MLTANQMEKWILNALLTALCCVFLHFSAFAQYRFENWTTDHGLPQNTIPAITQTRDGYLWVGTYNGLARFDGVRFTVFDKSNTKAFSNNRVSDLYEDSSGALWIGIVQGGVLRYQNGVFTPFTCDQGLPDNNIMMGIRSSPGSMPLIFTDAGAVWWRDGRFVPYEVSGSPNEIQMYQGPSGTNWVVDKSGIHERKNGQRTEYVFPVEAGLLPGLKFYEDRDGALWLSVSPRGLFKFKDGKVLDYTQRVQLRPLTSVSAIVEDADGSFWFSTNAGLIHFKEGAQDEVTNFTTANGLSSNGISKLFLDRENTLWIGTDGSGLNRMTRQFISGYSVEQGLSGNVAHSVMEDHAGNIWVATQGGLSRITNGVVTNYLPDRKPGSLPLQPLQSLAEDHTGRLWIGGWNGLCSFQNGVFSMVIPNINVHAMREDRQGNLWIGTHQGLIRYANGLQRLYQVKDGLPNDIIRVIHEDRDGALWIGTEGGLAKFAAGRFTVFTAQSGLTNDHIWSMYEDADGVLWLGTFDSGLMRFKAGRFTGYTTTQGLYYNGVFQILEDGRGNLWMSCYRGLHTVNKQQLNDFADGKIHTISSTAYGKADGMPTPDCNGSRQPSGVKSRDGKLWFTTVKGVVVVRPNDTTSNPLPPNVQIEEVTIDNKQVEPNVVYKQEIRLLPGQTSLEIRYTGLSFQKAEQTRFRYKLIGQDQNWVEAGLRRIANYSYLPPGSYTFQVLAANGDGVWNTVGANLRVIVVPPFYRTWWFITLIAICLIGLVGMIYRVRIAQLQKEHEAKEAFSRQMLESQEAFSHRLIESQEAERKRIAAELHDSLGQSLLIIKNHALLGLTERDNAAATEESLTVISDMTSQALDEARQIAYNLRPYQIDRFGLTRALQSMISRVADASEIAFHSEVANLDGVFSKENEINFYRVVQECINNILKHSGATETWIEIVREPGRVSLRIADNGKGFSTNTDADLSKRGFGLTGLAERARMLGGEFQLQTEPGRGTVINVSIVLPKAAVPGEPA